VFSAVALLLLVLLGLARTQGWFEKTIPLQFVASSAADLRTGMQVRLFGIAVGKVKNISLSDDGRVLVNLSVNDDYRKFLHQDTHATLAREGMFGDSYIVLESAQNGGRALAEQAQIPFDAGTSLGDLVTQLSERLFPMLDELTRFTQQLNAPQGHLQSALLEMKLLLSELRQTRRQMDQTLKHTETLMSQRIPATLDRSDKMLADFSHLATNLDQRMASVSTQLDQTLKQFEQTGSNATKSTEELNKLLQELRPSLQKTLQDADALIKNAHQTMTNMQTHWPFTPEN
jgi:phospholipid/cholesterol/gamma-HCH transport system substrate-binding protein